MNASSEEASAQTSAFHLQEATGLNVEFPVLDSGCGTEAHIVQKIKDSKVMRWTLGFSFGLS